MSAWVPSALVFLAVISGTVALALTLEVVRGWRRRRVIRERVGEVLAPGGGSGKADHGLFRSEDRAASVLETVAARVPMFADLPRLLEHAGVSWSGTTFLLLTVGAALAGFLAGVVTKGLLVGALAAGMAGWMPYFYLRLRRSHRLAKFETAFPEAVDMLGRAIRAGHPLSAGIQMVGQEMGEPVGAEFRQIFEQQRFGVPFPDALMGMVDRVDLVDVRIFATAVLVQREVGGNLAEILDNIAGMIRARFKIRRQLRTYTAQGRLSGVIVGVMPFVVGIAFYALNPSYVRILFEHPLGRLMLAMAIILQIFGYLWIRKIVNIEI